MTVVTKNSAFLANLKMGQVLVILPPGNLQPVDRQINTKVKNFRGGG
jgi:hypothetical protein